MADSCDVTVLNQPMAPQRSAVIDWLLEGDPAIRWQVMRDLLDAPPEHRQCQWPDH